MDRIPALVFGFPPLAKTCLPSLHCSRFCEIGVQFYTFAAPLSKAREEEVLAAHCLLEEAATGQAVDFLESSVVWQLNMSIAACPCLAHI